MIFRIQIQPVKARIRHRKIKIKIKRILNKNIDRKTKFKMIKVMMILMKISHSKVILT